MNLRPSERTLKALRSFVGEYAGAVLFLHLFHGAHAAAEVGELGKFLLDGLEPFMPLAVSDLSLRFVPALTAILLV